MQNKDASQNQWEDFDLLEEDDSDLPREDDLTLAGRELRNNLNSGQRETEVPDGESRWGEPDDDTKQNGNERYRKGDEDRHESLPFEQDTSLPLVGMMDFSMAKVVSAYATQQRKQGRGEYKQGEQPQNKHTLPHALRERRAQQSIPGRKRWHGRDAPAGRLPGKVGPVLYGQTSSEQAHDQNQQRS
jgi:hypothetical protein